jgi:hypothetical protein
LITVIGGFSQKSVNLGHEAGHSSTNNSNSLIIILISQDSVVHISEINGLSWLDSISEKINDS